MKVNRDQAQLSPPSKQGVFSRNARAETGVTLLFLVHTRELGVLDCFSVSSTLTVGASTWSVASDLASDPGGGASPHKFLKQKSFAIKNCMILFHLP